MNNNFFALTRYLRDYGIEAELLVLKGETAHFSPSDDSYDDSYESYTKHVDWGMAFTFSTHSKFQVAKDLEPYTVIIACGAAMGFIEAANRNVDIFVPYGGDISQLLYYFVKIHPKRFFKRARYVYCHKRAVSKARVVAIPGTNLEHDDTLKRYAASAERWLVAVPMVYTPQYSGDVLLHEGYGPLGRKLKNSGKFLCVSHSRHVWSGTTPDSKGTEKFIKAWARFASCNMALNPLVVMTEYGIDAQRSRDLIKELGIESTVYWLPLSSRKELIPLIKSADLVVGQFQHSYMTYGVACEAMAVAKPLLGYRDDAYLRSVGEQTFYPMLNCFSENEIFQRLEFASREGAALKEIGEASNAWFRREIVDKFMKKIVSYIENQATFGK